MASSSLKDENKEKSCLNLFLLPSHLLSSKVRLDSLVFNYRHAR